MNPLTLESGLCPRCRVENSKHIDACHACGAALPWRGYEASRLAALEAEAAVRKDIAMWLRLLWLTGGGLIYLFGAFLWAGNIMDFYPTIPGLGYLIMAAGICTLKRANDLS